jgi:hypothetical protein
MRRTKDPGRKLAKFQKQALAESRPKARLESSAYRDGDGKLIVEELITVYGDHAATGWDPPTVAKTVIRAIIANDATTLRGWGFDDPCQPKGQSEGFGDRRYRCSAKHLSPFP